MINEYVFKHINRNEYLASQNNCIFLSRFGWKDYLLNNNLVYSYRDNYYDKEHRFNEKIHAHTYYEFIFYLEGGVEFINNDRVIQAPPCSLVCFKPKSMHNARLVRDSRYKRHIFYLRPDLFLYNGIRSPILDFINSESNTFCLSIPQNEQAEIIKLLTALYEKVSKTDSPDMLTAVALSVIIFDFFNNHSDLMQPQGDLIPDNIIKIKKYIDDNYATISSVEEIAQNFFYSREYVSRLFKKYYNISISNYLTRYRIFQSQKILEEKGSITEACYSSGFNNMATYISSFKKVVGILPSQYIHPKNQISKL